MSQSETVTKNHYIRLTPSQRNQLEAQCRNQFNWSDFGHWMGSGAAPNCTLQGRNKARISHTLKFLTDESALKWNLECEKAIRYAGHFGTAVLTTVISLYTGGIYGMAAGTLGGVMKDEIQAGIEYPRMERGWSYEIVFEHDFKWSPHPYYSKNYIQTFTGVSRNHEGKVVRTNKSICRFNLDELPEEFKRFLASAKSKRTSSVYK